MKITKAESRKVMKLLLASVEDPKDEQDLSLDEVFQIMWKNHWNSEQYIVSGWANEVARLYENIISPHFGDKKLSHISTESVRSWHRGLKDTPTQANRALSVLSKLFVDQKSNPCVRVKPFTEKKRSRFATAEEIKHIGEILQRESVNYPNQVAFIYILMFSGSRPKAIENATWDMLRFHDKYAVLKFKGKSTAKTGEEEIVILPEQAMRLIAKFPRNTKTILDCKFPRRLWERIRREAGCEDLWARDWRRTFATVALSNGISSDIIGELLNHKSAQTTAIYAKLQYEKRVNVSAAIADNISNLLKGVK